MSRPFEIIKIGIDLPREVLYDRINRRVDQMLADGLEAEVRALYPYRELNALQTVGYREFFDYFDGRIGYDEAVELIKPQFAALCQAGSSRGFAAIRKSVGLHPTTMRR